MKKRVFVAGLFIFSLGFNSQTVHAGSLQSKPISKCTSEKNDELLIYRITDDIYRIKILSIDGEKVSARRYLDIDLREREEHQLETFKGLNGQDFFMDIQSYPRVDWQKGEKVRNSFLNSVLRGHFKSGFVPEKNKENIYAEDYKATFTHIGSTISSKVDGDLYIGLNAQNMYDYSVCEGKVKKHISSKCRSLGTLRIFYKWYYFTNSEVSLELGTNRDDRASRGSLNCKYIE